MVNQILQFFVQFIGEAMSSGDKDDDVRLPERLDCAALSSGERGGVRASVSTHSSANKKTH